MSGHAETTGYPRLSRRIQGALIDGVVIPVAAVGALIALTYAGVEDGRIKVAVVGALILLLDPVAVSVTGGTVGHHLVGMRVRRVHRDMNLNLFLAVIRFTVKTLFGLFAFFVILLTRKRQALHDLAARSIIVFKDPAEFPEYATLPELTRDDEDRAYASSWRRILVIATYWLIGYLTFGIIVGLSVSRQCVEQGLCTKMEAYGALGGFAALIIVAIATAFLGWRGQLYGCRKRPTGVGQAGIVSRGYP